jgi:hypothetical protein
MSSLQVQLQPLLSVLKALPQQARAPAAALMNLPPHGPFSIVLIRLSSGSDGSVAIHRMTGMESSRVQLGISNM